MVIFFFMIFIFGVARGSTVFNLTPHKLAYKILQKGEKLFFSIHNDLTDMALAAEAKIKEKLITKNNNQMYHVQMIPNNYGHNQPSPLVSPAQQMLMQPLGDINTVEQQHAYTDPQNVNNFGCFVPEIQENVDFMPIDQNGTYVQFGTQSRTAVQNVE